MGLPNWLKLVLQYAPLALAGTPLAPLGPAIGGFMAEARQLPNATGQQMNDHVVEKMIRAAADFNAQPAQLQDSSKQIAREFIGQNAPAIISSIVNITHEAHKIQGHEPIPSPAPSAVQHSGLNLPITH